MATVPIGKEAVENSIYRQAEQIRGDLIILQGTDDDWLHGYWAGVPIGTDKTDTKKRFTVPFVLQLKLLERIIQIQKY